MSQEGKPGRPDYRALSTKTILVGTMIMAVVAVGSVWLLLAFAGDQKDSHRLEIIKTAGTILIGTLGAAALFLTARRQRFVELDGTARRIGDVLTKSTEQLGSDQAAVQLAGLYALERLAQDNPSYRQTTVDIICGYLRLPYSPPRHSAGSRSPISLRPHRTLRMRPQSPESSVAACSHARQEQQVRFTAQQILSTHLQSDRNGQRHKPGNPEYWPDINLNLTRATLVDFNLNHCHVHSGVFNNTRFIGYAGFEGATFTGNADFSEATFFGAAYFRSARFVESARFYGATFTEDAWFSWATFTRFAEFYEATFAGVARFCDATFAGDCVRFSGATFIGNTEFSRATFTGYTTFNGVTFNGDTEFSNAHFTDDTRLPQIMPVGHAAFSRVKFAGYTSFEGATFENDTDFDRARAWRQLDSGEARSTWPPGWKWGDSTNTPASVRIPRTDGAWHFIVPTENVDSPQHLI